LPVLDGELICDAIVGEPKRRIGRVRLRGDQAGIVLIKARSGHVIGIENLHFSVPASDSVQLETTAG